MAEVAFTWTDRAIDILKTMYGAGDSHGVIARELGTTRNSCIGKANRLGLQREAKARAEVRKVPPASRTLAIRPKLVDATPAPASARQENAPGRVSFLDLKPWQCLFIPGQADGIRTMYCGDPVASGEPYCRTHRALCWSPAPKGQPRAISTLPVRRAA